MKFLANVGRLKEHLKCVIDVATKGAIKDWQDSYRVTFEAKQNELIASAFGGRLAVSLSMTDIMDSDLGYDCKETGKVTVSALDLARNLEAFSPENNVIVAANDKEFVVTDSVDSEQLQAQPVYPDHVNPPKVANSFAKEVTINRGLFVSGFNKISYAIGFEKNRTQYLYWKLDANKDGVRFASGTGGRFAIFDVKGKSVVKTKKNTEFLFPKEQSPVISSILDRVTDDDLVIKQASRDGDVPEQIVFEVNAFSLVLVGFDTDISWPNLDSLLSSDKNVRLETHAKDWEYATKGLMATFNEDLKKEHDTHESDILLDFKDNVIKLMTKQTMRASRKVPIVDVKDKASDTEDMKVHCTTPYLAEIFSKGDKGDAIILEFIDGDHPVFVRYPEKSNGSLGTMEQFTTFFASLKG